MSNKRRRQEAIRDLIESRPVASQEELRKLLHGRGWDVAQSTLSRDLREMRLARVPAQDGGARYAVADATPEGAQLSLERLLPALVRNVDGVGELAVVRTQVGSAEHVAAAIDAERWPEVIGTIAGDDTILIICRSGQARDRAMRRIRRLTGRR